MNIRYLILSLTTRCNLACAYCYNGEVREFMDMSEAVLDKALDLVEPGNDPFHLQLTGGEPTLVPTLIERAVRRARGLTRPCTIGIQTNATRVTPDLVKLFKRFDVRVGVSLDGPPSIHQALRGQVAQTLSGLRILENHNFPFRVTTVVSQSNVGHLDQLVYMLAGFAQARGIGLDLLVRKGRGGRGDTVEPADVPSLRSGVRSMLWVLKAINDRRMTPLQLRELELLKKVSAARGQEQRFFCYACRGESAAVHPDGRLFPCGQTLVDARFAAGDVWKPDPERLKLLSAYRLANEQCNRCPVNGRCPGECPSRLHYNQADAPALACELYRTLWREIEEQ
ncbi:MAG TPA: radical SAM protein [Desulfobacterales bacterium]|nr:radical SAM protein [Desulfobacterales bacterium]HQN01894.1 radical SAM protein [Candidatus Hydrogenedentota bacterium]